MFWLQGTAQMIVSTDGNASFATFLVDLNQDVGRQVVNKLATFTSGDGSRSLARGDYFPSNQQQCVQNSFRIDGK